MRGVKSALPESNYYVQRKGETMLGQMPKKLSRRGMSFRVLTAGAAVLLMVGGITVASSATPKKKTLAPFKVEIVGSLTGASSSIGTPAVGGYEAVIDKVNAAGGIKGHKIAFTVLNDQSSTTVAPTVALQAASAKPTAILNATNTTPFAAELPTFTSAKEVTFTNSTTTAFEPWLYSDTVTTQQNIQTAVAMASAIESGNISGKRIALVGANSPGVVAVANALGSTLSGLGATLVSTQLMVPGSPSFSSQAANVVGANPQLVIIYDTPPDALVETNALRTAGYLNAIASNYGAASDLEITTLKDPLWFGEYPTPDSAPGTLMYATAKKYGLTADTTSTQFGATWSLAYMLVDALNACGYPCKTSALEKHLNALGSFTAPGGSQFGPYEVSSTVHAVAQFAQLFVWNTGKQDIQKFGKPFNLGPPFPAS
jgi:ABC-type branched-subunit amino acid transport system substrate-binding protein